MKESCQNCAYSYNLVQYDYTGEGCKHTKMDGHICMADAGERSAIWMIGEDDGMCECYQRRVG